MWGVASHRRTDRPAAYRQAILGGSARNDPAGGVVLKTLGGASVTRLKRKLTPSGGFTGGHTYAEFDYLEDSIRDSIRVERLIAIEALACRMRLVTSELEGLLELLGDDFLKSDVVEVVPLPNLYNTYEPYKLEIDDYVQGLEAAIE